ncbi:MAG: hypothetical protein ACRCUI_02935 [Polymorphobacter sp.]
MWLVRKPPMSARALLRAFQLVRGAAPDPGFMADLAYLQNRDLDLSVRLAAMLTFNALMVAAAINPITASPGAPLSLDAGQQPAEVTIVALGVLLIAVSALACVRAMLIGEEFDSHGVDDDPAALAQRLFAAYCLSVDKQAHTLTRAVAYTIAGGIITLLAWVWILIDKM